MNLDGIAGRALLQRLTGVRRKENDRLASNDNDQPVEVTRKHREAEARALGRNKTHHQPQRTPTQRPAQVTTETRE